MVIEYTAIAAGVAVVGVTGSLLVRAAHRRQAGADEAEVPRENPSWHLLGSDQEVREALERAIACEQASISLSEHRAHHFAEMRSQLAAAQGPRLAPPTGESEPPASPPVPAQPARRRPPTRMPRAS